MSKRESVTPAHCKELQEVYFRNAGEKKNNKTKQDKIVNRFLQ